MVLKYKTGQSVRYGNDPNRHVIIECDDRENVSYNYWITDTKIDNDIGFAVNDNHITPWVDKSRLRNDVEVMHTL